MGKSGSRSIRESVLEKHTPNEIVEAANIVIRYEVDLSYAETTMCKGAFLLHILDKLNLKIVKK